MSKNSKQLRKYISEVLQGEAIEAARGMWTNEEDDIDEVETEDEDVLPRRYRKSRSYPTAFEV